VAARSALVWLAVAEVVKEVMVSVPLLSGT